MVLTFGMTCNWSSSWLPRLVEDGREVAVGSDRRVCSIGGLVRSGDWNAQVKGQGDAHQRSSESSTAPLKYMLSVVNLRARGRGLKI